MSDFTSQPIRLLDDPALGEALRGDLALATDIELTGLDVTAGLSSLNAAVAAEAGATGIVAPVAATGMSTATKAAIAGVVLAAGIVGALIGLGGNEDSVSTQQMAAVQPIAPPVEIEPIGSGAAVPEPAPTPAPTRTTVEPAPVELEDDEAPAPAAIPEEEALEPVATPLEPKPRHAKSAAAPLSAEDAMAEASLVSRARKALVTSPQRALDLANQAKREFPRGMLVEEREAIAVQALAKLGQGDKASQRGEKFLRAYGRGPHAAAVRSAIGR